jgi:putative membrane protein
MTTAGLLTSLWAWEPSVVAGCVGLALAYAAALRFRIPPAGVWYAAGVALLLLSLVSPIDVLGDTYLFSAHMIQHLLLLLVVPPLLILGLPRALVERALRRPALAAAERALNRPLGAWIMALGTLWVWHLPLLYDAALADERLHIFEHLCFLVTATIFWWPLLHPIAERRLGTAGALVYLVAATFASDVLGIIITFAPAGFYPPYSHPAGLRSVLTLIRDDWGISAADDQQIAGVLMWMGGSVPYAAAAIAVLARWFGEPDADILPAEDARAEAAAIGAQGGA